MKTILVTLGLLLAITTTSRLARAWDGPTMWYESATGGPGGADGPGGGGIIGTGGASDHNITCANCHIKGDANYGTVDFKPTFNPPIGATYKLGQTYQVTFAMVGEHLGLGQCMPYMKNINGFAAAFEDDSGKPVGSFRASYGSTTSCPPTIPKDSTDATYTYNDCHAVIGHDTNASWTFSWTAPAVSTPVTLYYAGVDGDCMMDSLMDDAKVGTMKLGGGVAMRDAPASGNRALAWLGLLPAIGFFAASRRAQQRR